MASQGYVRYALWIKTLPAPVGAVRRQGRGAFLFLIVCMATLGIGANRLSEKLPVRDGV